MAGDSGSPATTLLALPTELLLDILSRLSPHDLVGAVRVCRQFYDVAVPMRYARIPLGYFGATGRDAAAQHRLSLPTLQVLKALGNPDLARHVVFLDHVNCPLPTFTRTSDQRPPHPTVITIPTIPVVAEDAIGNGDQETPPTPPPLPPPPPPQSAQLDGFQGELESTLGAAMDNLSDTRIQTIRIVSGLDPLVHALLRQALKHDSVRRLWVEDVPLRCLTEFLITTPELGDGNFTTGLTHIRMRKLKEMGSNRSIHRGHYRPNDDCIPLFLGAMISHSPNLTSLALDAMQNLEALPEILEPLTFPHLHAFQLRSQTEDNCIAQHYLTDKRLLEFLLRHPRIKAFAWPAENFVPTEAEGEKLLPLIEQFSRRLVWFRSDCSLLDTMTFDHHTRYSGPPKVSRYFLGRFLRKMEALETIKLQGDYQQEELHIYLEAIMNSGSSETMRKFSLIRAGVEGSHLSAIARAMPNLRELKLCAYFAPGLVSLYDLQRMMIQDDDGEFRSNMTLDEFLGHIGTLKHLHTLTIPFHPGADVRDRIVSDIWDAYRQDHPPTRSFSDHPHFKPLAAEIDMEPPPPPPPPPPASPTPERPEVVADYTVEPYAAEIHPRAVVNRVLERLRFATRRGGLRRLRTVRCFFILALDTTSLDISEFFIDTEWKEEEEEEEGGSSATGMGAGGERQLPKEADKLAGPANDALGLSDGGGRLELRGTPVLAYGWGTGLWLGDTKSLDSRAWF